MPGPVSGGGSVASGSELTLRSTTPESLSVVENGSFLDLAAPRFYHGGSDPTKNNLKGWSMPFVGARTADTLVSGTLYVEKMFMPKDDTLNNLFIVVNQALTLPTAGGCRMALYSAAGTLLTQSADQGAADTNWSNVGAKAVAMGASQTLNKGDAFYAALLFNCTGTVLGIRTGALVTNANIGLSGGANLLFGVAATAQASMPASIVPANIVGTGAFVFPIGFN